MDALDLVNDAETISREFRKNEPNGAACTTRRASACLRLSRVPGFSIHHGISAGPDRRQDAALVSRFSAPAKCVLPHAGDASLTISPAIPSVIGSVQSVRVTVR